MTAVVPPAEPQPNPQLEIELDRYTCATCAYGVSVMRVPERCPMCGDHAWLPETRRS
jgi:rubrerythrin